MLSRLWNKRTSLMVGIDIGSHSIKALLLSEQDGIYKVESFAIESMPKGAIVDREIQDIEAVGKALSKIRKKISASAKEAAAAVSGSTVITKIIYMDVSLSDDELASQIEIEADSLIPYPLDEVSLDFERLDVNDSDPSKVNVLLSAARTESVEARVTAMDVGGFKAKVIDVESYSLARTYELSLSRLPDDAADKTVALIDIGATMTLIAVIEAGKNVYTRDQLFGGEQYTRSIISYYNKSFEEAELAKITGDLPPNYTFEVLAPFQTVMVQQIRRAVQMFLTSSGKEKIDYLVVSGGTALVEGIEQLLIDELGVHTIIANPFKDMLVGDDVELEQLEKVAPEFVVAAGLALRSFSPWHI